MESLAPALLDGTDSLELLLDCMPAHTHVLLCDPERIRTRAHDLVRTSEEFLQASWAAAAVGGKAPIDVAGVAFQHPRRGAGGRRPIWICRGGRCRRSVSRSRTSEPDYADAPWLEGELPGVW